MQRQNGKFIYDTDGSLKTEWTRENPHIRVEVFIMNLFNMVVARNRFLVLDMVTGQNHYQHTERAPIFKWPLGMDNMCYEILETFRFL